jgi:hypothetical protein
MKKQSFLRLLIGQTNIPFSIMNRIIIGLNKVGLVPKSGRTVDVDLNWYHVCLIIYSVYMCQTRAKDIDQFARERLNNQEDDKQLLGGILEALMNADKVAMVLISKTNVIVMREDKVNLFFGYATESELSNVPKMVTKAFQVPGSIFRNLSAGINLETIATLN